MFCYSTRARAAQTSACPAGRASPAAATAARLRYHPVVRDALLQFAVDENVDTALEAIEAIRSSNDDWFTGPLVGLLGNRATREGVRDALIERGDAALQVLAARLVDPETPISILRHIPRTIARFDSTKAAEVLINSLSKIDSGMVRFKLLRGLETLLLDRNRKGLTPIRLDASHGSQKIRDELDRTLERSLELLRIEAVLEKSQIQRPELATVGGELLIELLQDKRELGTGRIITLLGLIHRRENFKAIEAGLRSTNATERASAEELIETILSRDAGRTILSLTARGHASQQLLLLDPDHAEEDPDYTSAVRSLSHDPSRSLCAVALYYAGEIQLEWDQEESLQALTRDPIESEEGHVSLQDRALAILRDLSDKRPRSADAAAMAK